MDRGLIKNALVTIALTLILLTTYTLGTLTAPSRAEKEQINKEPTPQEKTATQTTQEVQTPPQDQVTNDSAIVQRLDRIASILEDKLSRLGDKLDNLDKKLSAANAHLISIALILGHIDKYWMKEIKDGLYHISGLLY